jgi:hypothetical protein
MAVLTAVLLVQIGLITAINISFTDKVTEEDTKL